MNTKRVDNIMKELTKRLENIEFYDELVLTMKVDNSKVIIHRDFITENGIEFFVEFKGTYKIIAGLDKLALFLSDYKKNTDEILEKENQWKINAEKTLKKIFEKDIKGKNINDIDSEKWSFYSDYYKERYGYRPKQTAYFK